MAGDRLTGSDKRALLLWVLAGILGVLFASKYFFRAFPEASVNFKVSREEALSRAKQFATGLGEDLTGYRSTIVFDVDDNAKVYLERQLGLERANELMSSTLNIWYWDVRFFKPEQEEEFHVRVNPAGQIVGYDHKIKESQAGAALDRPTAQSAAQDYLRSRLGLNLKHWDALPEEANSKKLPNRVDWTFTWEKHGFRAKDAPYRLEITLQGDRIGGSKEFLKVPEAWERSYVRLRSGNDYLTAVFYIPYLLLIGAAAWFALILSRNGQTSWGGAIKLGIFVALLFFLQDLNNWPLWEAAYRTTDSYASFFASRIALSLFGAILISALTVVLPLPSAEPLYRASQPGRLRLAKALTARGLRTKEFFSSAVGGLSMAAVHIGYLVVFYLIAGKLGAWAPQELDFDNSLNTAFPWISGAAIGVLAASSEEFLFRLFAIPFFHRFTRSRWVAVILPAFLWSFLHSNYPQEPAYTRGIEVGLIGILAGLVMLRWGILTTLIWHYTVDASLVGLLLVRSHSMYLKISGVAVGAAAVAPLAFAVVSYLSRGHFEEDEDLLNGAVPMPDLSLESPQAMGVQAPALRRYNALAPGVIGFLAVCLVVGGLLTWRLKPPAIGGYLKLSVDSRAARARAGQIMRQHGLDPSSYRQAVIFADIADPVVNEYLRQRIGIAGINAVYSERVPVALWQVRYFRDSRTEEYSVKLKPDGSMLAFHHRLAEDTPGASLSKEQAVARAEKFLREERRVDLSRWSLVEANSDKRHQRIDHELAWQQNTPVDTGSTSSADAGGHAYVRMKVAVLGDEVTDYRGSYYLKPESREELEQNEGGTYWTYIKIPDDWRRKQQESTLLRMALAYGVPVLFFAGLGGTALIVFLKNLKSETARKIPWRRIASWSAWALVANIVALSFGNSIGALMSRYDTAISLKTTIGSAAIGVLILLLFSVGSIALLFGMAWYYAARAFGEENVPGWLGMPGSYYRDALWIGLGGTAGLLGLERLVGTAAAYWSTVHRALPAAFGQDFDAILPAAAVLGGTLFHGLFTTGIVVAIASFLAAQARQAWLRILLLLAGALALVGGGWGNPADFAKQFLAQLILLGVVVFGVCRVVRFNLLGYFLIVAGTSLVGSAVELLAQPDSFYRANGYAVLLVLALLLAWPLAAWRMRTAPSSVPGAS